jgi:hypothetical protein
MLCCKRVLAGTVTRFDTTHIYPCRPLIVFSICCRVDLDMSKLETKTRSVANKTDLTIVTAEPFPGRFDVW